MISDTMGPAVDNLTSYRRRTHLSPKRMGFNYARHISLAKRLEMKFNPCLFSKDIFNSGLLQLTPCYRHVLKSFKITTLLKICLRSHMIWLDRIGYDTMQSGVAWWYDSTIRHFTIDHTSVSTKYNQSVNENDVWNTRSYDRLISTMGLLYW